MRISKPEEYGIRLAMSLAIAGRQLSVTELAELEDMPEATVAKVLSRLRQAGLVAAARGRQGGYELAVAPEAVTVLQVLRAMERGPREGSCCQLDALETEPCVHRPGCGLRPLWRRLEAKIHEVMGQVTLADIARPGGGVVTEDGRVEAERPRRMVRTRVGSGRPSLAGIPARRV